MAIEIIDSVRVFLEQNMFGSSLLLGLFIVGFIAMIYLLARIDLGMILILLIPLIIALSTIGILPAWLSVLFYVGAGILLAIVTFELYNRYSSI